MKKKSPQSKMIIAFLITFVVLAIIGATLYYGYNIDAIQWYWQVLIAVILLGVPALVYIKSAKQ